MAIAFVQQVGAGSSTSGQSSFTSTATSFTAGNFLFAIASWSCSGTGSSVTITNPSAWTDSGLGTVNDTSPNGGAAFAYLENNPGGSQSWTWTAVANGGGTLLSWAWAIYEFSGVVTSGSPFDLALVSNHTGSSTATPIDTTAASGTTASTDLLIQLATAIRSSVTISGSNSGSVPSTGWTVGNTYVATVGSPYAHVVAQWQIPGTAVTSPRGEITPSTACSWVTALLTVKAAGGTTYPQTVAASTASSVAVGTVRSRLMSVVVSTATSPSVAIVRSRLAALAVTTATVAGVAVQRSRLITVAVSSPTVVGMSRAIGKLVAVTTPSGVALSRAIGKTIAVVSASTPATVASRLRYVALAVVTTSTVALSRSIGKLVAVATPSIAGVAIQRARYVTVAVTTSVIASIVTLWRRLTGAPGSAPVAMFARDGVRSFAARDGAAGVVARDGAVALASRGGELAASSVDGMLTITND